MERRTRYEIFAEILNAVMRHGSCTVTRASYGANLPVDRAKSSLSFFASRGFVREELVGDSRRYGITRRGVEYLETFRRMQKMFVALSEDLP